MESILEKYISFLKNEKNASENTVQAYIRDIKQYLKYLDNINMNILLVNKKQVDAYFEYLKGKNIKESTIARKIITLKQFYNFLVIEKMILENPINLKSKLKKGDLPEILEKYEIELLLSQPSKKDIKGIRDKAILEFAYGTGMRVSELIDLNIEDVNLEKSIVITNSLNDKRIIPFGKYAKNAISKYLKKSRPYFVSEDMEKALFLNRLGKRFTRQGIWKILKYYKEMAKINKDINPHIIRHSFATHLVQNGADIEIVKKLLGNIDSQTMQKYVELARIQNEKEEKMQKLEKENKRK